MSAEPELDEMARVMTSVERLAEIGLNYDAVITLIADDTKIGKRVVEHVYKSILNFKRIHGVKK